MVNLDVSPRIINLSKRPLTDDETKVLLKGPKFTPTPKQNLYELRKDIYEFCRKLRLSEFFYEKTVTERVSVVECKSSFTPERNRDTILDNYVDFLCNYEFTAKIKKYGNLQKNEWLAIQLLRNDDSITIKVADKGNCWVIMDSDDYKKSVQNLLLDGVTYKRMSNDHTDYSIMKKIENFAIKYSKMLTKQETKYLTDFSYKSSQFYGLPKIHKSEKIKTAIKQQNNQLINLNFPDDLPFRPIIGSPLCPTNRLSSLIDRLLQPFTQHVKSFVKDTQHFLQKVTKTDKIGEDDLLVTWDVVSLYTNITESLAKNALNYWMGKYPDSLHSRFSKNFILEATNILLRNNTFQFNGDFFLQTKGCSMGSIFSPIVAILSMGYLEEKMYEKAGAIDPNLKSYLEKNWQRFIDDCFMIWKQALGNIEQLNGLLEDLDPHIKFTMESSKVSVPFLDVLLTKKGETISTDIYRKPTDTFNYLPFDSAHPRATKINIPYNLSRRIRLIVSDNITRYTRYDELETQLVSKNYPKELIKSQIERAESLDRTRLLEQKSRDDSKNNTITMVYTYNQNNPDIRNIIQSSLNYLKSSHKMANVLKQSEIIFAKRQPKNLKALLCCSKYLENKLDYTYKITRCKSQCVTCTHIVETSEVKFRNSNVTFKLKNNFSCNSKFVIYLIVCGCGLEYIGECQNLKQRTRLHRSNLKCERNRVLNVSKHLYNCGDGTFKLYPFYQMPNSSDHDRRVKERYFINKYKPQLNGDY